MTEAPTFVSPDVPPEDKMAQVRGVSAAMFSKIAEKKELERQVEALNAEIHEISSKMLPDLMAEAGVDKVGIPEFGVDVRLEDWVHAVLPREEETRSAAIRWLEDNDAGNLIKSEVTVRFDRTEHNMAVSAAEQLREAFPEKDVVSRDDVHHMTYTAWAKGEIARGAVLPLDLLGVKTGRIAKVVPR